MGNISDASTAESCGHTGDRAVGEGAGGGDTDVDPDKNANDSKAKDPDQKMSEGKAEGTNELFADEKPERGSSLPEQPQIKGISAAVLRSHQRYSECMAKLGARGFSLDDCEGMFAGMMTHGLLDNP